MKTINRSLIPALAVLAFLTLYGPLSTARAQGTAFTYQGRLLTTNGPAAGLYDLTFALYNAASGGSQVGSTIQTNGVFVTNGLFMVMMDFGGGVFDGTAYWLQIGVRTNGGGSFTNLSPRQELTPAPYAVFAEGANAAGLSGTIPTGDLSGTYSGAVNFNNAGNSFTGNGSGLTGLNASQLTTGTISDARLTPDVALTDANQTFIKTNVFASGGGAGRFIISNTSFSVDTNLFTGLSLQYDATYGEGALMSSYNDGLAYLSFYTKQGFGYPIEKQMIVDRYGGVAIDQQNANGGVINNDTTNGVGLTFGINSGEGIASKRTAGGNQYGLDFYTDFTNRMSLNNGGNLQLNGNDLNLLNGSPWNGIGYRTNVAGLSPSGGQGIFVYGFDAGYLGTVAPDAVALSWDWHNTVTLNGLVGIDTTNTPTETLEINGTGRLDDHDVYLRAGTDRNHGLGYRNTVDGGSIFVDGPFLYGYNGGCLGLSQPDYAALTWNWQGDVWISNNCSVASLTIRGGADLAEPFNISSRDAEVPQGAVVVIDEQNPGRLRLSEIPYDTHVAGVVSGANGIHPGIQMHQQGLLEGGKNVALTGRVYVQAEASNGAIHPGDLLTTSSIPGYAMKVTDHARAVGAILGKAMSSLSAGKGMVLVLVTLQ